MGRTECPDLNGLQASLRLEKATPSTRAKWRSSRSAYSSVLEKCLTPPTLSERPDSVNIRQLALAAPVVISLYHVRTFEISNPTCLFIRSAFDAVRSEGRMPPIL